MCESRGSYRDVEEASTDPAVSLGKKRGIGRHVIVEEGSARVVLLQSKLRHAAVSTGSGRFCMAFASQIAATHRIMT
jgi:hypothetical protein